jgi:hypothetical protein
MGQKNNITINQAIEVEGTVLPAGSYVLKLVDSPSNRNLVSIWNEHENRLIATVFTIPIYRFQPPDKQRVQVLRIRSREPPALHAWFYPGDQTGFEFRKANGPATVEAAQRQSTTVSDARLQLCNASSFWGSAPAGDGFPLRALAVYSLPVLAGRPARCDSSSQTPGSGDWRLGLLGS